MLRSLKQNFPITTNACARITAEHSLPELGLSQNWLFWLRWRSPHVCDNDDEKVSRSFPYGKYGDINICVSKIIFFGRIILNDFDISDMVYPGSRDCEFFFCVTATLSSSSNENPSIEISPSKNIADITISFPAWLLADKWSFFRSVAFSFQNELSKEFEFPKICKVEVS